MIGTLHKTSKRMNKKGIKVFGHRTPCTSNNHPDNVNTLSKAMKAASKRQAKQYGKKEVLASCLVNKDDHGQGQGQGNRLH